MLMTVMVSDEFYDEDDVDDDRLRNSSSSDDEPRHTPSPPGPNPHRVKR